MPLLTEDDLAYLRRQVGGAPTDDDLQDIYDRVGTLDETALEVLETRLAEMTRNPAQFTVVGVYSQDVGDNIAALEQQVESLQDAISSGSGLLGFTQPVLRWSRSL